MAEELTQFQLQTDQNTFIHTIVEEIIESVDEKIEELAILTQVYPTLITYTQQVTQSYLDFLYFAPDLPFEDFNSWDTPNEVKPCKMDAWAMGGLEFYEDDPDYFSAPQQDESPTFIQQTKKSAVLVKKSEVKSTRKTLVEAATLVKPLTTLLKSPTKIPQRIKRVALS